MATQLPVLILVRDLLFQSRITGMAKNLGVEFQVLRDPSTLQQQPGRLLIADLNQNGVIDAAAGWMKTTGKKVVGFVSHVDAGTVQQAREAGIEQVLARSAFVGQLPQLLGPIGE